MFTDTYNGVSPISTLKQRGAGKAAWRRVIDNIIASEKEDMRDMAVLQREINDPKLLKIISDMLARKAIRVMELADLYHYKDGSREKD